MRFIILLALAFSFQSFSCDCKKVYSPLNERVLESGTPEFFVGEVKSATKIKDGKIFYIEYEFELVKKYNLKNTVSKTIKVRTRANKCKSEFEIGQKYLIGVSRDHEKRFWTDQCHFKRNFKSAKNYMEFLDERYPN